MSTDEKSLRIAQAQLSPGETLAWAGPAPAPRRARLGLLIGAGTFLGVVILFSAGESSLPPFALVAGLFFGCFFGVVSPVMLALSDRAHNRPTHYAITDRRILFLSTLSGETIPVAAFGPADIPFVRRRDRRDGTSDLVIGQDDGPRRGTVELNGITVPFPGRTAEVALRGVADGGAVEALIEALRSGSPVAPVAAPVAPVSPPDAGTEIVLKKSATPWFTGLFLTVFGLPFLGTGIAAGLGQIAVRSGEGASAAPTSPIPFALGFGGMGLICSLIGLGVLLWRHLFTADPVTRTYHLLHGFVPFAKPVNGTFDDFSRISLTREEVPNAESPYNIWWYVRLHWKDRYRPPCPLLTTPFEPHGAGEAARMAAALGLPLDARGAVTPVPPKAQAAVPKPPQAAVPAQAGPRPPAPAARGRRLKIAGAVALGLLLVNSLVKGVVYEERWTAPDGSAITRRTTGFWGQTVAVSSQGQRSSQTSDQYFFYTSSASEGTLPDVSGPRTNYHRGLRLGSPLADDVALVPRPSLSPGQVATDSFPIAAGATLSGQDGPGWAGRWSVGPGPARPAEPPATRTLAVDGHSVRLSAPPGQFVNLSRRLAFGLGRANTTAWIGVTIKRILFTPVSAPPTFGGVVLGVPGQSPGLFIGDTGSGRWGMDTTGPPDLKGVVNAEPVVTGAPVFLVVRADFGPGADRFTLYQDPTPGRVTPDVRGVVKTDLTLSGVDGVTLAAGRGGAYTFDGLRVGPSYRDVAPSGLKHAPDNVPTVSPP